MTDQNRTPAGVPTGGQFAASQRSEAEGVTLDPTPAPTEKPCFGCGHQHDPDSPGACYEAQCLPGCTGCREQETIEARGTAIARIVDAEDRAACEEYTTRYALPPTSLDYEARWTSLSQRSKAARDLAVGDRLTNGRVVTAVDTRTTPGVVYVHTDGHRTAETADGYFNHGDPVHVHEDRVDLSDPDWFEVEAERITTGRIVDEQIETGEMDEERAAEVRTEVRRALTRCIQPSNISPLFHDGPDADPRYANGRAKVGDNVVHSQPMYGSTAYEVLGKRAYVTILGHDGTQVLKGETGEVEYVLRNVETGHQTTSNLRNVGWNRIPAPGDDGPAAQAQRLDR